MNDKKIDFKVELIFILMIFLLFAPLFEGIFVPVIKIFTNNTLSMKLIVLELTKFSVINVLLLNIKNEKIKKILIFLSMFIYTLGHNIFMFILTILFQEIIKNKEYSKIKYVYMINVLGIILHKYRMIGWFEDKEKNIIYMSIILLIIIIVTLIYLISKYRKEIFDIKINKTILNILIIGMIIFLTLFRNNIILNDRYIGIELQLNISVAITLLTMFIFYYFDINLYERRTAIMIYILFFYFITYHILRIVISYKIMAVIVIVFDFLLVLDNIKETKSIDENEN
ncbi:hypothetical protein [Oceanivirga salmonicida]|uniref:hypothetical protein n=1 Tax=Oceanivirga salmonicida TaxID=1769291 RepID=UPI00082F1005|nr:hypothetical protein [Oceanivirga salmonicida]